MFKVLLFLSLFYFAASGFVPANESAPCNCPSVTNLEKTAQSAGSATYSWDNASGATQYKVWYVRQEDSYSSGYYFTNSTSYQFSGLRAGYYTFYFQTLCEGGTSGYIGIEDIISN